MEWILGVGFFVAAACIVQGILLILRPKWDPASRAFDKRLETFTATATGPQQQTGDIKKRRVFSDIPRFNDLLAKISMVQRFDDLVVKARSPLNLGTFLLISCILALSSYLILFILTRGYLIPILFALGVAATPFLYLLLKIRQRAAKFEKQLPDALDLMARSLRAGHAFSGGLQMVAQEFDEPIGVEFMQVLKEINFGASVDQALKNMTTRVDVPDLKFFTISVIIQRESGGNLADILQSIAHLMRERFKLLGKIKALSAEGKLSAIILIALPFVVVFALTILNPKYLQDLVQDAAGKVFIIIALCMMGLGVAIIRKIINIRV
ncbi:MAG: type II secretion system F family protein [Syntrophorhabdaceae bacterium]|nr:type II secretion system F family protein [Syntrophorhabdaceae bacterium]MDD4196793.1 type II secretion system F family protein [Syntrophorhabdaceae bacterium]